MKVECPVCKKSDEVDDARIPQEGINARCPKCNNVFRVEREMSLEFTIDPVQAQELKILSPSPENGCSSASIKSAKNNTVKLIIDLLIYLAR